MTVATAPQTCTEAEYLAAEVESQTRNEYRDGEIVPMTGGLPDHNKLISALSALLWFALRKQARTVFVTDQRLWIPERNIYTYPDVMVVAEPLELKPDRRDTVMNPLFVIEVLSASTEQYDRGRKFEAYRTIPAFQEYWLVTQDAPLVETFVRQADDRWLFSEHRGLDATAKVESLDVEIALADLCESIEFDGSPADAQDA